MKITMSLKSFVGSEGEVTSGPLADEGLSGVDAVVVSPQFLSSGEPFVAVGLRTDVRLLSGMSSHVIVQMLSGSAIYHDTIKYLIICAI
jgi:hypothetical protein